MGPLFLRPAGSALGVRRHDDFGAEKDFQIGEINPRRRELQMGARRLVSSNRLFNLQSQFGDDQQRFSTPFRNHYADALPIRVLLEKNQGPVAVGETFGLADPIAG